MPVSRACLILFFSTVCIASNATAGELFKSLDDPFVSHSAGNGTLFSWRGAPAGSGGPNLDEPLVTDRPDFTEASSTVGRGVFQIEFGYTYTYNSDSGESVRAQSFGEPLVRYGIFEDWLEFRIALFPVDQRTRTGGVNSLTSGTEDLYLGLKLGLTGQHDWLPEMALVPQMTVPTGSSNFSNEDTLFGLNWLYSWEINDIFATGGSTQVNRAVDGTTQDIYSEWAQSWTVVASLTDNLGVYSEWYGLFPNGAETAQTEHYFNGGFTYLLSNDVQFDIRGGVGLNDAADDYFIGTGLSIRSR